MQQDGQECVCHMPDAWSVEYIKSHWKKLEKEADISFFQSWPWMDAWITVSKTHIRPLIFKVKGKIVGISFVGQGKTKDLRIFKFKTIFPWGTGYEGIDVCAPEYNTPITISGYEKIVRKTMVEFLIKDKRFEKFSRIDFHRVPENEYKDYIIDGISCDIYKYEESAEVDLKSLRDKNDSLNSIISKGAMTQIKKSIKLYEEKFGKIRYEVADNTTKAHNWFVELGKLNQKRFNKKGQKGVWDYPKLLQMQRALLDRYFSKGCTEVVRVCAGNKVVGYLYNFIFRDRIYFYMGGFVFEDDNKFKPGLMTHYYAILHHLENGRECYDFMAGNQSYKRRLGGDAPKMLSFTLTKKSIKYSISKRIESIRNFFLRSNNNDKK